MGTTTLSDQDVIEYFTNLQEAGDENQNVHYDDSEIVKFFDGKSIFITGATGFLGKLVVEKLLRVCCGIKKIYVLVRAKKGKSSSERLDEIYSDIVYSKLSKADPKFRNRIVPLEGDICQPGFGLSLESRKTLSEEVNVFYHIAATVKFNEKLKVAYKINVEGTKEALFLAKDMRHLVSFVHISTAFAFCQQLTIGEEIYETPEISSEILNKIHNDELEPSDETSILGKWPNTYTFTKAMAEQVVEEIGAELPCCIFRPAIVTATYKEPIRSWIDNVYGPTGIVIGAGTGVLHCLHCDESNVADVVPADYVINAMLTVARETAMSPKPEKVKVYNYVSAEQNPLTWKELMEYNRKHGLNLPTIRAFWYYSLVLTKYKFLFLLYTVLFHYIPGFLADTLCVVTGKKPQMLKLYKKIYAFGDIISYFTLNQWKITNQNVQDLWKQQTKSDQTLFPFDISAIDWNDYFRTHTTGLRLYIVKDDISTMEEARKKWMKLYIAHKTLQVVAVFFLVRFLYFIFCSVFNFL